MKRSYINKTKLMKGNYKMIQIRKGVFETNSSSTHSIAIPRNCTAPSCVYFREGEFGWEWDEVDAADYFYTAIYDTSETAAELEEKLETLKDILNAHNIEFTFYDVDFEEHNGWLSHDGYIDHGYELKEFVDELLNDGDKLVRFLGGGLVFTGNDNSDTEERCFIERTEEYLDKYDWESKTTSKIKNPYYMSDWDNYEWHYKGN